MPLSRYKVGSEYALGGPDLYRAADQHDPEAVLDGVAMAGLVGVLRQLGDLAEFAAQVFHGLYDEVMSTSARGHGLILRVQQLESELPLLEKESCHRDYLYVASNRGIEWHANPRVDHGVVTRGDTPHFIMESIKQCRGPPKLFMLDKYDIGGEGTCLKRYTDPFFFKTDAACSTALQEGIQRERRPLRAMEIRPNLQNSEIFGLPIAAKNTSRLETGSSEATDVVPNSRRRLKYRQKNGPVFRSFRPELQNLYEKASTEEKPLIVDRSEVHISLTDSPHSNTEERDIMVDTAGDIDRFRQDMVRKSRSISEEALSRSSDARSAGSSKGYNSEVDIYVDALTTMDSEVETDSNHKNHGPRTFARMDSNNACSDAHNAAASRSSSLEKNDSPDMASAYEDRSSPQQEFTVSTPQVKQVAGEHERTSSLEELLAQEIPPSCDHERISSLEEFLTEDFHASEHDTREQVADSDYNNIASNAVSNGTQDITTKKAKEAKEHTNITAISFKKIASKSSKYVGGMEMIASKVGILPRKLSKKHDPFSDSLRIMAKQVLEFKYDGTQDTDLYDFEANGEECDIKCLEMYEPPVATESAMLRVPSDSPHRDVNSRECQQEEVNNESEHDVPPTDSPQDSVLNDGNGFLDTNMFYLSGITSPSSREEEGCAGVASDEKSTGMLNHTLEHAQENIEEHPDREVTEDSHVEVVSEDASDTGEDVKEVSVCDEQVNAEDIEEILESDGYALDDEEILESDGVISSPASSKQSDDPCRITPLTLTDADDTVVCKGSGNYTHEVENIILSERNTESDLPIVVTEIVSTSEAAVPDNEQSYLHPESTFGQDTVLSNYEVVGRNEQVSQCSSSMVDIAPDLTVNIEEIPELCQPVNPEPPNSCNNNTEVFGDPLAPDSRDAFSTGYSSDVPLPIISSFDWMLNGAMQQSLTVLPPQPTYGNAQGNGSSEDAPPLPPLPPMQWRTNKPQSGSSVLSAKTGRPPRPKPAVKQQESQVNSSPDERKEEPDERNEEVEMLQERCLHNGLILQNENEQSKLSSEEDNYRQEEDKEYGDQDSDPFPSSEVKSVEEVASVKSENLHTLQLTELIVIPEEAWSEFGDMKLIAEQEGKHYLRNRVSDWNGLHTADLSTEKTIDKHQVFVDHEDKDFSAADNNEVADSEENKLNGVPKQNDMLNLDVSAQLEDRECCASDDNAREFSSALEEELAKSPTHPVPRPPTYPLPPVTSHDRSMLRKAPTLVQPSSKLSDEKNTMLEQIKNQSFNLKPVLAKRPNVIGGPRTNLQVAAIIERAHAIRQAVADDEEEDTWSE